METEIKPKTERQSNLELLRILSMFLIVLVHYEAHGVKHVSDPAMNMLWRSGSIVNQWFCHLPPDKRLRAVYLQAVLAFLVLRGGGG